jgi:hypothetical protein
VSSAGTTLVFNAVVNVVAEQMLKLIEELREEWGTDG